MDPIFWLGLSILLVAVSIAAVLLAAIPALKELGRAAQGAEKLFDTLNRELPPTLEAIRLTSLEFTELTDDLTDGVQGASSIVQQVDDSVSTVREQAQQAKVTTQSVMAGMKAAWKTLTAEDPSDRPDPAPKSLPAIDRHQASSDPQAPPPPNAALAGTPHLTPVAPAETPKIEAAPKAEALKSRLLGYENNGQHSTLPGESDIRLPKLPKRVESQFTPDE